MKFVLLGDDHCLMITERRSLIHEMGGTRIFSAVIADIYIPF